MFTNETQDKLAIGNKIQLRDLCFVLGAAPDQVDTIAATFHLGPGLGADYDRSRTIMNVPLPN